MNYEQETIYNELVADTYLATIKDFILVDVHTKSKVMYATIKVLNISFYFSDISISYNKQNKLDYIINDIHDKLVTLTFDELLTLKINNLLSYYINYYKHHIKNFPQIIFYLRILND